MSYVVSVLIIYMVVLDAFCARYMYTIFEYWVIYANMKFVAMIDEILAVSPEKHWEILWIGKKSTTTEDKMMWKL